MKERTLFKKSDLIIIAICLAVAGLLTIPRFISKDNLTAVITVDGKEYTEINFKELKEEKTVNINGVVIKADSTGVWFADSDCPDKICVRTGILSKAGDSSACIPKGVTVYIKGEKIKNDIDGIAY